MGIYEFTLSRAIIKSKYTIILTLGAVIGVMCLIVITSLFNNYYLTSENVFMGIHPHIRIHKENMTQNEAITLVTKLKNQFKPIEAAAPALYKEVRAVISKVNKKKFFYTVENGENVCFDPTRQAPDAKLQTRYGFTVTRKKKQIFLIKGISLQNNETVSGIKKIINGSLKLDDMNLNHDANGNPLPWSFYMQQDLFPGAVGLKDFLIQMPGISQKHFHLLQKGTLNMGTKKGRYPLLVMSLKNAQQCLGLTSNANIIEVKLQDPYQAEEIALQIQRDLGTGFQINTWIEQSRASFAFLKIIKIMILSIIFSIAVVAAIGMISTLTLIVMQNRGKIAILKSMGIKDLSIYKIFVLNTGLTGIIGVVAGTLLGFASSHALIRFFGENLKKLGIKDPRILITPQEIAWIAILVVTMFLLTAIIPSRRAISTDVVDCLQEQ